MRFRLLLLLALVTPGLAAAQPLALQKVDFQPQLGAALPMDARFVDQSGREVTLADCAAGQPAVLVLAYYRCPMLCTLVLQTLMRSLEQMPLTPGRTFQVIVVSIDPREPVTLAHDAWRDATRRMSEESARGIHFLTDPHGQAGRVADAIGYRYAYDAATDQYAHPAGVVVLTPGGLAARYLLGLDYPPRDLRLALVEASDGRIGTSVDRVLLRCFRYDPMSGRYGMAIQSMLRGAGVLFALAGTAGMAWLWRRDRRLTAAPAWREGRS
jgi:protein SCO1/2